MNRKNEVNGDDFFKWIVFYLWSISVLEPVHELNSTISAELVFMWNIWTQTSMLLTVFSVVYFVYICMWSTFSALYLLLHIEQRLWMGRIVFLYVYCLNTPVKYNYVKTLLKYSTCSLWKQLLMDTTWLEKVFITAKFLYFVCFFDLNMLWTVFILLSRNTIFHCFIYPDCSLYLTF